MSEEESGQDGEQFRVHHPKCRSDGIQHGKKNSPFFSSYYVLSEFLHTLDLRNNAEQLLTTKCAAPKRPRKAAGHLTQDSPSEHQIGLCAQIINDQYCDFAITILMQFQAEVEMKSYINKHSHTPRVCVPHVHV